MSSTSLNIAMLSLHSSPVGPVGTQNTGGMSIYVRELARWLGRAGHRVDIFTSAGEGPEQTTLYPNVRLMTVGQGRFAHIAKEQLPNHLPQLYHSVEQYRQKLEVTYDIIHSHYWISGVVGAMAQSQWQCPHLMMFHTLGAAKNRTRSSEHESALRLDHEQSLVVAADHIIVPTQLERDHLVSLYHAHPAKISVIPCGVNLELFHPGNRQAARQQLGLAPQDEVVLYVGRFAPLKGVDTLIQAAARMQPTYPHLKWLVVGGDDPDDTATCNLAALVERLNLQQVVHFQGRIAQHRLPLYYRAADMLALPSHYESFGLVVLEALACGTPVVATPVGAAADLVQQGVNGTLIAAPEPQALAEGVSRILALPPDQRPTPQQVHASVQTYGWEGIASAIVQIVKYKAQV